MGVSLKMRIWDASKPAPFLWYTKYTHIQKQLRCKLTLRLQRTTVVNQKIYNLSGSLHLKLTGTANLTLKMFIHLQ